MNKLTVVTYELIAVDCRVVAEMTDGSLLTLRSDWGNPPETELRRWRYITADELRKRVAEWNANRRAGSNAALHADKVRRLGYDYAARGYQ